MEYEIEKARPEDLPAILVIYAGARAFMAKTSNPNQWKGSHPSRELLEQDIREGNLYVRSFRIFIINHVASWSFTSNHKQSWDSHQQYG